jgi:hypothetical protein
MRLHVVTEPDGHVVAVHPVTGHGHEVVRGAKAAVIGAIGDQVLHDLDMPDEEYSKLRSETFLRGPVYLDRSREPPAFVLQPP